MSTSPLPPTRIRGDLSARSSLCATPFAILKLADSSLKSVFSWLLPAPASPPRPRAAQGLLQGRYRVALRRDVDRDVAAAFEPVVAGQILEQRPDVHAREV